MGNVRDGQCKRWKFIKDGKQEMLEINIKTGMKNAFNRFISIPNTEERIYEIEDISIKSVN